MEFEQHQLVERLGHAHHTLHAAPDGGGWELRLLPAAALTRLDAVAEAARIPVGDEQGACRTALRELYGHDRIRSVPVRQRPGTHQCVAVSRKRHEELLTHL